jgi:S-adenosylmethionine synthetase
MDRKPARTAEHVSEGHPDKFCDQVADRILDEVLKLAGDLEDTKINHRESSRTAIECLAKDNLLIVSGEAKLDPRIRSGLDVVELAREVWKRIGYGTNTEELTVINHIRSQSPDIQRGTNIGGAGDQGIMVGYATRETPEHMPREWVLARDICMKLRDLRTSQTLARLKTDCKSQVSINEEGTVYSVVVAAQHEEFSEDEEEQKTEEMARAIIAQAIQPIILPELTAGSLNVEKRKQQVGGESKNYYVIGGQPNGGIRVVINGTGAFAVGGPTGDAGVVGRKIVVDAYGPRVPVGGGAYSGKDPTKVDRSAAYMARLIARTLIRENDDIDECTVTLAYAIGQEQPEMISAITNTGRELSQAVRDRFKDLSPAYIIELLGLRHPTPLDPNKARQPTDWSYSETAAYGHYGRDRFPWERITEV